MILIKVICLIGIEIIDFKSRDTYISGGDGLGILLEEN